MRKISQSSLIEKISSISSVDAMTISGENVNFLEDGILDSLAIVQLVNALEDELSITFKYTDLESRHFQNLDTIADLLRTKYQCEMC